MSDTRFFDSQTAFTGGMQGSFDAALVAEDQFFKGINLSIREGVITSRPSFEEQTLDFSGLIFNETTNANAVNNYNNALNARLVLEGNLNAFNFSKSGLKTLTEGDTTKTFTDVDECFAFCTSLNQFDYSLGENGSFYGSIVNITGTPIFEQFGLLGMSDSSKGLYYATYMTPKTGATLTENLVLILERAYELGIITNNPGSPQIAAGDPLTQTHVDDLRKALFGIRVIHGSGSTEQVKYYENIWNEETGVLPQTHYAQNGDVGTLLINAKRMMYLCYDFFQKIDVSFQTELILYGTPHASWNVGDTLVNQNGGATAVIVAIDQRYNGSYNVKLNTVNGTFAVGDVVEEQNHASHNMTITSVDDQKTKRLSLLEDLKAITAFHYYAKENFETQLTIAYDSNNEWIFYDTDLGNTYAMSNSEYNAKETDLQGFIDAQDLVVQQMQNLVDQQFDAEIVFKNGNFQGCEVYNTDTALYTVCVISGHIFLINMSNYKVTVVTEIATQLNEYTDKVYMTQVESHFVIQDGINIPKILTGSAIRSADHSVDEVPVGTNMAYGQGRLCVQISPKHFRIGDIHLAFDPINVLKFRETKILNEGGGFTVSGKLGEIVSLQFANVADTSTGDGPLLAICQNGFSTFAINNPRATWSNIPIQKVQLIGSSITGNEAYTNIGEDILYRSPEGIRSYAVGRTESESGFRYTELSREVSEYIDYDTNFDAKYLSMAFFDKRLLSLTSPKNLKARSTKYNEALADYTNKRNLSLQDVSTVTDDNIRSTYETRLTSLYNNTTTWTPVNTNTQYQKCINGDNQYLELYNHDIPSSFTIYYKFTFDATTASNAGLVGHNGGYLAGGWTIGVKGSGQSAPNQIFLQLNGTGTSYGLTLPTALVAGQTYELVVRYNGSTNSLQTYLDNVQESNTTSNVTMTTTSANIIYNRMGLSRQGGWNTSVNHTPHRYLYYTGAISDSDLDLLRTGIYVKGTDNAPLTQDIRLGFQLNNGVPVPVEQFRPVRNFATNNVLQNAEWKNLSTVTTIPPNAIVANPSDYTSLQADQNELNFYRTQLNYATTDLERIDIYENVIKYFNSNDTAEEAIVNKLKDDYLATKYLNAQLIDDVTYKAIISYDFSLYGYTKSTKTSQSARISSGSYDGIWTGLNASKIYTVIDKGVKRCFAFAKHTDSSNPTLNVNTLYEITKNITGYDNKTTPIQHAIETRSMPHKTQRTYIDAPFVYKYLEEVTCWLDKIHEDVNVNVDVRSDVIDSYTNIGTLQLKAKTSSTNNPLEIGAPQSRAMIRLKDFTEQYESTTQHPIRNGNTFQFRLTWTGLMQLKRFLSSAREIAQPKNVNTETEKNTYPIDTYDQFGYSSN